MSFQALARLNLDYAVSHFDQETVDWKPSSASVVAPKTIDVVIDKDVEPIAETDVSHDTDYPSPVIVHASKTDVSAVIYGRADPDRIIWGEKTYRVAGVLSSDPSGWELYCVR